MRPSNLLLSSTLSVMLVAGLAIAQGCKGGSGAKSGSGTAANEDSLTVFAAASLTESFNELARQFEKANPGVKVTCQYAGSGDLLTQLDNGARADVFASASPKEMKSAIDKKLVAAGADRVFARNRMVIICSNKAFVRVASLTDLATPNLKLVIALEAVPIGRYTLVMLGKAEADPAYGPGFTEKVKSRVIFSEANVKVVLDRVRLGEADAGIVYITDVTRDAARDVSVVDIPTRFNEIATYPIAPLKKAAASNLAARFIDFVTGPDGQEILRSFSFMPAATTQPERSPAIANYPWSIQ